MLPYVVATCVLWAQSCALAVTAGLLLAAATVRPAAPGVGGWRRAVRWLADAVVTLTRGVPTSLLVVTAGIVALRGTPPTWLPDLFPGTPPGMEGVAWAVVLALAFGSAGHFAVIFRTACASLGRPRREQVVVLGMRPLHRLRLVAREAAGTALAPAGTRCVHHLHNTAFAALFPVADLFGWVQERANDTFQVTRYALAGAGAYVVLSGLIWAVFRVLEYRLVPRPARGGRARRPAGGGTASAGMRGTAGRRGDDETARDATALPG